MKLCGSKCIGCATALIIAICLVAWVWSAIADAQRLAEESAQRALFVEVVDLLAAFHEQHDQYPDSLNALPLTYPDGGNESTLASLTYESNGKHYSLITKGIYTGQKIRESR